MIALSIRQPHVEAILQGIKTIEYRSRTTKTRGHILLYAPKSRYTLQEEVELLRQYGITIDPEALPRGVLVGTVELIDACGGKWKLANPVRIAPVIPKRQPQPVFFRPF